MPGNIVKAVGPFFGRYEQEDWLGRYLQRAAEGGTAAFVCEKIMWTRTYPLAPEPDPHQQVLRMAGALQGTPLDGYLGINLLNDARDDLATRVPRHVPLPHDFSNPLLRTALALESLDILNLGLAASGGKITHVALVMEMDYYYTLNPTDYTNLMDAVVEARNVIKAQYPDITVVAYFALNHLWAEGLSQADYYERVIDGRLVNGPAAMDALGGSTYPLGLALEGGGYVTEPEQLPAAYYTNALDRTLTKPFHIVEAGWPSEPITLHGIEFDSTQALQERYVIDLLGRQLGYIPTSALILYFLLHDIPAGWPPEFLMFKDMGLWDADILEAKAAWIRWRDG